MPIIIYCRKCSEKKDRIDTDGTRRCSKCRKDQVKVRTDKRRIEKGLRPVWRGGGRPPYCYKCDKIKENINLAHCYECKRKEDNDWRLKTGRTKRHRTGKCRCGQKFASFSKYQCLDCYRKMRQEKRNDPKYKQEILKEKVRAFTRNCIKMGILIRENCKMCNTKVNVEAHHEDYGKPLEVIWLCRNHHRELHKSAKVSISIPLT